MFRRRIAGFAVAAIASAFAMQGVAGAAPASSCPRGSRQINLLYPYLDNFTNANSNTTITITNTTNLTKPESGACTINFYGAPSGTFATAPINAGDTYTNPISALNADFQGYAIANCCFTSAIGVEFGNTNGAPFSYSAQVSVPLTPLTVPPVPKP
jgi:hypothetical protein